MPLPKAILFDLDDTIVTEGARGPVLHQLVEEFRGALPPHEPGEMVGRIEAALDEFWLNAARSRSARLAPAQSGIRQARERVMTETFATLGVVQAEEAARRFSGRFTQLRAQDARVFPGARETLEILRREGVRLALVTNGAAEIQRAKLIRFGLQGYFDHIQIEGEHGFGKPEPRAYTHAMQALGVAPAETWMVGDNLEWEVAAPQRLGIYAVWHDYRGRGLPPDSTVKPDRIITQISELAEG